LAVGIAGDSINGSGKSPAEFYQFIDNLRALFPEKIRGYFYYKALKVYKYSYFPENFSKQNS
jgi:hypothetical protein